MGSLKEREASLLQMVNSMVHESFHNSGAHANPKLGLWAGWVSRAGSFSDCMPVWNETNDVCLIFAGEHFQDAAEFLQLRERGHQFNANDASGLVHLYEKLGPDFFGRLNGWFSGIILDLRQGRIVLFNDRYGLNRIYYHQSENGFYFASEAKALLKVLPQLRCLDMTGLGEFFTVGCTLQDRSLFEGIDLLPGASAWVFTPGQPAQKNSYFNKMAWEELPALSPSEYYDRLKETFTRILPRYLGGKEKVGLSLTGGLDSRMIMAGACPPEGSIDCHTFGGMYRECADVRLARRIARVCRQSHAVIPITSSFFSGFPDLAAQSVYYSDGSMDVMGSVELFVNRRVRESTPIRLTGNYGSEILRKSVAFKPVTLNKNIFNQSFAPYLCGAADTYARERRGSLTSFIAFKQVPWHHYARLAVEQSQLTLRSPFLDNELVALAFQAPLDATETRAAVHRYIAEHNPDLARIPTDRGVVASNGAAAGKLGLFRQEFMPRVEYVFDYGMPQWLARFDHVISPLRVERLFLGRQKFYHFRIWYRDALSSYVKEVLLDPRTLARPYLNGREVEKIVNAHARGRGNYTLEIHKLLSSELVQRHLIGLN
jgi:asparagine synthase (glutamine-hydrolysing)